jgi:hypothetical protein
LDIPAESAHFYRPKKTARKPVVYSYAPFEVEENITQHVSVDNAGMSVSDDEDPKYQQKTTTSRAESLAELAGSLKTSSLNAKPF